MTVVLLPKAIKALGRMNEPYSGRIRTALAKLRSEPPIGDIKSLTSKNGYRLRVGDYRVMFGIVNEEIVITDITTRGHAYKGGNVK
ncbi:hypothetical protein FACS18949_14310 [Clostridia bacterium]|nr:hypothetical protein FACS189425_07120 [Clostridia bacterium]GHV35750.1 hypothetical protein FACS18949_14310 [Clostridia bacterium]